MSRVLFIGDLHLGHTNMAIKRGFKDSFDHDNHVISCWNEVVNKKDVVYILGDVAIYEHTKLLINDINKVTTGDKVKVYLSKPLTTSICMVNKNI
jgi:calcineurin-like phosphoesterase family protein